MIPIRCTHCRQKYSVKEKAVGKFINCVKCDKQFKVTHDDSGEKKHALTDGEAPRLPEVNMLPSHLKRREPLRSENQPPSVPSPQSKPSEQTAPLFLHISLTRLIVMSIVSFGVYESYWIYKNWRYIKERDNLEIMPFWRGVFGLFHCHSLLLRIHEDKAARAFQKPIFSASGLATGWVLLTLIAHAFARLPSFAAIIIPAFIPSFLCLVPVQNYVNSVTEKQNPGQNMYGWSSGHIVCLVIGFIFWALVLFELGGDSFGGDSFGQIDKSPLSRGVAEPGTITSIAGVRTPSDQVYYDKKHRFSITYPADWEVKKSAIFKDQIVKFVFKDGKRNIAMLTISAKEVALSDRITGRELVQGKDELIKRIKAGTTSQEVQIFDSGTCQIAGEEAVWVELFERTGAYAVHAKLHFFIKGKYFFSVKSGSDSGKDFLDSQMPKMEKALKTLKFTQ